MQPRSRHCWTAPQPAYLLNQDETASHNWRKSCCSPPRQIQAWDSHDLRRMFRTTLVTTPNISNSAPSGI
ncbi:Uncharacterised protein [Vibrio cholerae]|nr:Uncharacterised protein [Vibrio cholerae]